MQAALAKASKPEDVKIPKRLNFREEAPVTFRAAIEKEGVKTREFAMTLYSGGPVSIGFGWRMIVDLAGMTVQKKRLPIYANHKPDQLVGQGKAEIKSGKLDVEGEAIVALAATRQIIDAVDGGFSYEASMGFEIGKLRFVSREDEPETVNGRTFAGPGYIVTKSRLIEGSFVPAGADGDTSTALLSDDGEVVLFDGDPNMSTENKDTEKKDPIAAFAAAHGEQVEKWRAEGHAKGVAESTARFESLSGKFAERPAFVVEQFRKGNDVAKASIEFADVLAGELKLANEKLAEATKKQAEGGGSSGVEFSPAEKAPKKDDTPPPLPKKRDFKQEAESWFAAGGEYKGNVYMSVDSLAWELERESKEKKAA